MRTLISSSAVALVIAMGANLPAQESIALRASGPNTLPDFFYSNARAGKALDFVYASTNLERPIPFRFEGTILCLGPYLDSKFASELAQRLSRVETPNSALLLKVVVVDLALKPAAGSSPALSSVTIEGRLDAPSGQMQLGFRTTVTIDSSYGDDPERSIRAAKHVLEMVMRELR